MWGHYCKKRQEFCQDAFEDHEELCVNCYDYKDENKVIDLKKIFNKEPATNTNCVCGANNSTADNDYVSMLEMFINKCYPSENFGLFNLTPQQAETHVDNNMRYLGYNTEMVNKACVDTINNFKTNHTSCMLRLDSFCNSMLKKPHKDYANYCSTSYKFVLTLILGYLGKLTSAHIVQCEDPQRYFENMISSNDVSLVDIREAIQLTRYYVEATNDINLAEGMRRFEAWWKDVAKENIPPKELTIADIEKQLGYKIKIVGDET
jgi:hypothetical protein